MRLPARVDPLLGESLESILERIAAANDISTAVLVNHIRTGATTMRHLSAAPHPSVVHTINRLTGLDSETIWDASLAAAEPSGQLKSLSEGDQYTHRSALARGWLRLRGSQLCPHCLREDGAWRSSWRLPVVTVCSRHAILLAAMCPGCRRPFRDRTATPLRPVDTNRLCGNPLGAGPRDQCDTDLVSIPVDRPDGATLRMQAHVDTALARRDISILGREESGKNFLADLQGLTGLLLNLSRQEGAARLAPWGPALEREAAERGSQRSPRWATAPPVNVRSRAAALTAADQILSSDDIKTAAVKFAPWYDLVPTTNESRLDWLADRTHLTPTVSALIKATHGPRRRLARRLDASGALTPLYAIPQAIPPSLYQEHVAALMGCGEETGRCFVSLALARGHGRIRTWEDAATALRLPPRHGVETARAVSQRMRGSVEDLHAAIIAVGRGMDPHTSWRLLEDEVRADAATVTEWLQSWAATHRPRMKETSAPYAITWRWIHEAGGLLDTSPAWASPPTRRQKAAYRQFAAAVDQHQAALSEAIGRQTVAVRAVLDRVDLRGDLARPGAK